MGFQKLKPRPPSGLYKDAINIRLTVFIRRTKSNLLACGITWLPLQGLCDIRLEYLEHVRSYSTCASALMPWANKEWYADPNENSYVQAVRQNYPKIVELLNSDLIEPNALRIAFEASLADFNLRTRNVIAQLEALPSQEHDIIWSGLFMIEKEARKIRQRFLDNVEHHADTINRCVTEIPAS